MKSRIIGVIFGLIAVGIILYFVVPHVVSNFSSSVSPQEESGKGAAELAADSTDANLDAVITRGYTWDYDGKQWTWELQIPEGLYNYYKEMPRPMTDNYSVYVTHPLDDEYIGQLAVAIKDAADKNSYSKYKTIGLAAAFVQNLPYNSDSETTPYDEYARYPVETLVDDGGDCEDTSVLLAALLDSMGYEVVLVNPPDHLAVGILRGECVYGRYYRYEGGNYYYLETTKPGWAIGELPQTYRFSPAYVYGIEPIAVLTHSWTSETQDGSIMLDVTVENSGAIAADDVCVWVGLEAGEGQWLNSETSRYFALPSGCSTTVSLTLKIPPNTRTRLLVQIIDDGWAVDSSQSYWFDI
ncbi:hypothetical protein ES703_95860 [subsurface metagenome]